MRALFLILLFLVAGCAERREFPDALPATFAGDLPCADCAGIRHQLELFPDQAYFLRRTYLGTRDGAQFDEIGSWLIDAERHTLSLYAEDRVPVKFSIVDGDRLRKLDIEGREIVSTLNYVLTRTASPPALEPRLAMRGMYRYMADAGRFGECTTRRSLPVAQEHDNAALESAYGHARRAPGEELLAEAEGRIAMRPKRDGAGREPTLVVERLIGIWPGETCGARFSTEPLENTYWKLTRLGNAPVHVAERQREPFIVLNTAMRRAQGSGGCNRLAGSYTVAGDRLSFGGMVGTRMACSEGKETEAAFLQALARAERHRLTRHHLELLDATGALVARFESRLMN
jgi:copper homeostasis protein (lipoprotein)